MNTFLGFTVNSDCPTRLTDRVPEGRPSLFCLGEALTAGFITGTGIFSAYQDISLAAKMLVIIVTIFHRTL